MKKTERLMYILVVIFLITGSVYYTASVFQMLF